MYEIRPTPQNCRRCGVRHEAADLIKWGSASGPCWPCWIIHVSTYPSWAGTEEATRWIEGAPAGWWQRCERCDERRWVTSDRPLCPTCLRVPARWRATGLILCKLCSLPFRPIRRNNNVCCQGRFHVKPDPEARRKYLLAAQKLGTHTAKEWRSRVAQYRSRCAYCGIEPLLLTKDHIVPISRGGSDGIANLVPACMPCNLSKSSRFLSEWNGLPEGWCALDVPPADWFS